MRFESSSLLALGAWRLAIGERLRPERGAGRKRRVAAPPSESERLSSRPGLKTPALRTTNPVAERSATADRLQLQMAFNLEFLNITAHRPWPMPTSPWIMRQTWHDLLFAHWPVATSLLRARIPARFEIDEFDGTAWIGVVPFHMSNVSPRGVPALRWFSVFPEINVRTYVRVGGVPGVYFFSLDATNPVAVTVARTMFHLPYFSAGMKVQERGGWIHYESRRSLQSEAPAQFVARYRPTSEPREPVEGTLEHFLTERYCLFTVDSSTHACRLDIHHPPWQLQDAEAEISVNTMTEPSAIQLPAIPPILYFSKRQDMVGWGLRRV